MHAWQCKNLLPRLHGSRCLRRRVLRSLQTRSQIVSRPTQQRCPRGRTIMLQTRKAPRTRFSQLVRPRRIQFDIEHLDQFVWIGLCHCFCSPLCFTTASEMPPRSSHLTAFVSPLLAFWPSSASVSSACLVQNPWLDACLGAAVLDIPDSNPSLRRAALVVLAIVFASISEEACLHHSHSNSGASHLDLAPGNLRQAAPARRLQPGYF